MLSEIRMEMRKYSDKKRAEFLKGFFKTGKGQYGEGDTFLGVTVPDIRKISKKYDCKMDVVDKLLNSKFHEERLLAVILLVGKYENDKEKIYRYYIRNSKKINNWDLVDVSAHKIVGPYLIDKDKKILYKLAKSKNLWDKRISIVSTFYFIKNGKYSDTLKICEILLRDENDLIHKATGWMLREIGKMDKKVENSFLDKYYKIMPRTMLRYAIEKHSEKERKFYMNAGGGT